MRSAILTEPLVIHALPGRVRVHLPAWPERDVERLEAGLGHVPGVLSARANPLTGNLLIVYDDRTTDLPTLLTGLRAGKGPATSGDDRADRPTPPASPGAAEGPALAPVGEGAPAALPCLAAPRRQAGPFPVGKAGFLLLAVAEFVADLVSGNLIHLIAACLKAFLLIPVAAPVGA
jgi:hypothetical protein